MVQVSKRLIVRKEIPLEISKDLVSSLDIALAEYYCTNKDFEKGLRLYRDIIPTLPDEERNNALNKYINFSMVYAQTMSQEKMYFISSSKKLPRFSPKRLSATREITLLV